MIWPDRQTAGSELAKKLTSYKSAADAIVIGLPRGGVVTAHAVAKALHLPLDIIVTRKIGAPLNGEYAIGAIDETGQGFFNEEAISSLGVSHDYINRAVEQESREAKRRLELYRAGRPPLDLKGQTAILVDDGIATGFTCRAAIASCSAKQAARVVVASPVIAPDTLQDLKRLADEVVYLQAPDHFGAVGQFYEEFEPISDNEVTNLLIS